MTHTIIVGANSQVILEFIKHRADKKYILLDLPDKLDSIKDCVHKTGIDAEVLGLDVRNVPDIQALFHKFRVEKVVFSELIYAVGINHLIDATDMTEQIWDDVVGTNLKGCFFIMKEVALNMIENDVKSGSIVNISSQHAFVGNTQRAAYCASKAGLVNLNRVLALEWAMFGIRVNSIAPTWILNAQNEALLMSQDFKRKNLRNIPVGRYCETKDVVGAINYLLSEDSEMITGQCIILDGGWTAK